MTLLAKNLAMAGLISLVGLTDMDIGDERVRQLPKRDPNKPHKHTREIERNLRRQARAEAKAALRKEPQQ